MTKYLSYALLLAITTAVNAGTTLNINVVANTQVCGAGTNSTVKCDQRANTTIGNTTADKESLADEAL